MPVTGAPPPRSPARARCGALLVVHGQAPLLCECYWILFRRLTATDMALAANGWKLTGAKKLAAAP